MVDVHRDMLDRLFAKYRHSPNILGVLEILASPLQDTNDAIDYILDHLSIDDAEGPLLDFIAGWIGVERPPLQETDVFKLFRDEDLDMDPENHHGLATDDLTEGGYLSRDDGLPSKRHPGAYVTAEEFRLYIRAKAAAFRKKATKETMFDYLLRFGVRARLNEGVKSFEIEPSSFEDFNLYLQYHIKNRGFRPCGIQVSIK